MSSSYLGSTRRVAADYLREQLKMEGAGLGALSATFNDEPPGLNDFLYDAAYLNHLRPTQPTVDESGYAFTLSDIQFDFLRNFEQIFRPDLYITMVEEFGKQWMPLPMRNMYALEWGKSCHDPETPIYNPTTGDWVKLRDFVAGPVASAYAEDGKVFTAHGTDAFKVGEGRMFNVTTQSGRKAKVYEGHQFLSWGQENYSSGQKVVSFNRSKSPTWKRLWDLKVGDHIAVSSVLPEPTNPILLPDWEVEWAGLMLGDGCLGKGKLSRNQPMNLTVGHQSPVTLQRAVDLIEEAGLAAAVRKNDSSYTVTPKQEKVKRLGNPMREMFHRLELVGTGSSTKFIPKEMFRLSNRQIAILVSRLIDTDGWVSKSNTWEVGYGTISEELADGVVNLLLRLGVVAEKKIKMSTYNGEPHLSFQVRVRKQRDLSILLPQLHLLDKEPNRLEALEWVSSRERGNLQAMHGDLVWDKIKSIEYAGEGEYWTTTVDGPSCYISNFGILDHNSGKDTTVRIGFARIASLLGHMKDPQSYFRMASFDSIHMLNVASNAQQARDAFFNPMKKLFLQNKYLSGLFHGDDPAEGANRLKLTNNTLIISGNSLAESQEGLNLIASVADEVSAFKTAEEYGVRGDGRAPRGADAIVNLLRSSGSSRFPETYKVAQISYPRFSGDAIEKAIRTGNQSIKQYGEDKSPWFVSGPYATWEVKPGARREHFQAHYDEDPEAAASMYECKPPKAVNRFIRDDTAIEAAFSTIKSEPIEVEYYWGLPPNLPEEGSTLTPVEGWQVKFDFTSDLVPVDGYLYGLHGDMAIVGDRAGIAMSHVSDWLPDGDDLSERPVVTNDFVFTFEADFSDPERPREIQIRWYRQLIWELIERGFYIGTVTFDQFQSTDMTQTLKMYGMDAGLLSLDRNDKVYQTFKDVLLDGRLVSYRQSASEEPLVVTEIKRLRKVKRKVDHPPRGSKDAADALAGSVFNAIQLGGGEDYGPLPDSYEGYSEPMTSPLAQMGFATGLPSQFGAKPMPGLFGAGSPSSAMW